jgi:hypothetical protein
MFEYAIAGTVIALAAIYCGRRVWFTLRVARGGKACGGCAKCPE